MLRADRDQLVLAARPYVARYLRSCARGYPEHVRDDMVAEGIASMLRSAETFDPTLSSFRMYAARRAFGAAQDMIRQADHLTRSERVAHTRLAAAATAEGVEPPSDGRPWSFDMRINLDTASVEPSPEEAAIDGEYRCWLRATIQRLPIREAYVIDRYYFGEQTLTEIGRVLGVTESRCSQLHTRALAKLRHQRYGLSEVA